LGRSRRGAANGQGGGTGVVHELQIGAGEHAGDGFCNREFAADGGDAYALHDGGWKHDLAAGLLGREAKRGGRISSRKIKALR
jgi:hypothetical protein